MADASKGGRFAGSALGLRFVVGVPLLLLALAAIWMGGIGFAMLVTLAMGLVAWEWTTMQRIPTPWRYWSVLALVMTAGFAWSGEPRNALAFLAASAVLGMSFAFAMRAKYELWLAGGLFYAGVPGVALLFLRAQPMGLELVLWVMGLVWATDILAYFAGRLIGGPRIWPAISPGKTWAGLVGGMAGAALFSFFWCRWLGVGDLMPALVLAAAALAIVAQAGDFFESWLKRRAGVKDSGQILPGHGGVMDRVDGLLPVAALVALILAMTDWADLLPGVLFGAMP